MFFIKLLFLIIFINASFGDFTKKINVGTVIFSDLERFRKCWEDEQIALVSSRMIYQNLLPEDTALKIENDDYFKTLVQYFKAVVKKVCDKSFGKVKHIQLIAASDALGGYLHHTALPVAKYGYYLGTISYEAVKELHDLYQELKTFLKTDGKGWSKRSCDFSNFTVQITPLAIMSEKNSEDACADLIYKDEKDGNLKIALPFFDSDITPRAMALPFKSSSLWNLESQDSSHILVKYYLRSVKCLTSKNVTSNCRNQFNNDFSKFIDEFIIPHICDNYFYSAFGSVFRIRKSLGTKTGQKKVLGNYVLSGEPESNKSKSGKAGRITELDFIPLATTPKYQVDKPTFIYGGVAIFALLWLIIGICLYCCGKRRKNKNQMKIDKNNKGKSDPKVSKSSTSRNDILKKEISKLKSSIRSASSKSTRVNFLYDMKSQFSGSTKKGGSDSRKTSTTKTSNSEYTKNSQELPMFEAPSSTTTGSSENKLILGYDFKTSSSSDESSAEYSPKSPHYKIS